MCSWNWILSSASILNKQINISYVDLVKNISPALRRREFLIRLTILELLLSTEHKCALCFMKWKLSKIFIVWHSYIFDINSHKSQLYLKINVFVFETITIFIVNDSSREKNWRFHQNRSSINIYLIYRRVFVFIPHCICSHQIDLNIVNGKAYK